MSISTPSRTLATARGKLALIRQVAHTGVMRVIDGLPLTMNLATLLLDMYDQLTPYGQEEFAAECNLSFWSSAQRLLSAAGTDSAKGVVVVLWAK